MDTTIYHSMHGMLRNQQIKEVLHVSMEQAKLCPNAAWHKDNDGNSYTKKVKNLVSSEKKVADWLNIPALKWLDICCGSCVIVFYFINGNHGSLVEMYSMVLEAPEGHMVHGVRWMISMSPWLDDMIFPAGSPQFCFVLLTALTASYWAWALQLFRVLYFK